MSTYHSSISSLVVLIACARAVTRTLLLLVPFPPHLPPMHPMPDGCVGTPRDAAASQYSASPFFTISAASSIRCCLSASASAALCCSEPLGRAIWLGWKVMCGKYREFSARYAAILVETLQSGAVVDCSGAVVKRAGAVMERRSGDLQSPVQSTPSPTSDAESNAEAAAAAAAAARAGLSGAASQPADVAAAAKAASEAGQAAAIAAAAAAAAAVANNPASMASTLGDTIIAQGTLQSTISGLTDIFGLGTIPDSIASIISSVTIAGSSVSSVLDD
ncbi:hypothetical protein C8F01DRAFT_1093925 [Mycena amicta]|nr:hypothetical protein C8F01DRAFT_1093925 [Mycena amicta]